MDKIVNTTNIFLDMQACLATARSQPVDDQDDLFGGQPIDGLFADHEVASDSAMIDTDGTAGLELVRFLFEPKDGESIEDAERVSAQFDWDAYFAAMDGADPESAIEEHHLTPPTSGAAARSEIVFDLVQETNVDPDVQVTIPATSQGFELAFPSLDTTSDSQTINAGHNVEAAMPAANQSFELSFPSANTVPQNQTVSNDPDTETAMHTADNGYELAFPAAPQDPAFDIDMSAFDNMTPEEFDQFAKDTLAGFPQRIGEDALAAPVSSQSNMVLDAPDVPNMASEDATIIDDDGSARYGQEQVEDADGDNIDEAELEAMFEAAPGVGKPYVNTLAVKYDIEAEYDARKSKVDELRNAVTDADAELKRLNQTIKGRGRKVKIASEQKNLREKVDREKQMVSDAQREFDSWCEANAPAVKALVKQREAIEAAELAKEKKFAYQRKLAEKAEADKKQDTANRREQLAERKRIEAANTTTAAFVGQWKKPKTAESRELEQQMALFAESRAKQDVRQEAIENVAREVAAQRASQALKEAEEARKAAELAEAAKRWTKTVAPAQSPPVPRVHIQQTPVAQPSIPMPSTPVPSTPANLAFPTPSNNMSFPTGGSVVGPSSQSTNANGPQGNAASILLSPQNTGFLGIYQSLNQPQNAPVASGASVPASLAPTAAEAPAKKTRGKRKTQGSAEDSAPAPKRRGRSGTKTNPITADPAPLASPQLQEGSRFSSPAPAPSFSQPGLQMQQLNDQQPATPIHRPLMARSTTSSPESIAAAIHAGIQKAIEVMVSELRADRGIFLQPFSEPFMCATEISEGAMNGVDGPVHDSINLVFNEAGQQNHMTETSAFGSGVFKMFEHVVDEATATGTIFGKPLFTGPLDKGEQQEAKKDMKRKYRQIMAAYTPPQSMSAAPNNFGPQTNAVYTSPQSMPATPSLNFGSPVTAGYFQSQPMPAMLHTGFGSRINNAGAVPLGGVGMHPAGRPQNMAAGGFGDAISMNEPASTLEEDGPLPSLAHLVPKNQRGKRAPRRRKATGPGLFSPEVRYDFATDEFSIKLSLNDTVQVQPLGKGNKAQNEKVDEFKEVLQRNGYGSPTSFVFHLNQTIDENLARLLQGGGFLA